MTDLLHFELSRYYKQIWFYLALIGLFLLGAFAGGSFRVSPSEFIFRNSTYTVGYAVGFLSLLAIFFATLATGQIIFREKDSRFELILYALPIRKRDYLLSRFVAVFTLSSLLLVVFLSGFAIGQTLESGGPQYTSFRFATYALPAIVFGIVNSFFCSAILCVVAWFSTNRAAVYVAGILLYIAYMVALIFSGSPLISGGFPQSETMVSLSTILDPFGISAFLRQTANWTVEQRNHQLIYPADAFLLNRIGVIVVSIVSLAASFRAFSFEARGKRRNGRMQPLGAETSAVAPISFTKPSESWQRHLAAMVSITKIDLKYLVKSVPFIIICLGFLFYVSMEMYGDIEKGIRLPQKYATSGLLASTIIDEFHVLCLLMILFYAHDIFWRSKTSNFHQIEMVTPVHPTALFFSKWFSLSLLIAFFSTLMILLGIVFQISYDYLRIDLNAYLGVYIFITAPLIVSSGIILAIHKLFNHKVVGLVISAFFIVLTASPLGRSLISHPLLRSQIPLGSPYSDFNGFGQYLPHFALLSLFGIGLALTLAILLTRSKRSSLRHREPVVLTLLGLCTALVGWNISMPYKPRSSEADNAAKAAYERLYRRFQGVPQPVVTDVTARIELFPKQNSYTIDGEYILKNKSDQRIDSVLVNFPDDFELNSAEFAGVMVKDQYSVINLNSPVDPGETANLRFSLSYSWSAVNGHRSFNAIIENGTFIRVSRYLPQIGYLSDNEVADTVLRKQYLLGEPTFRRTIDEPKNSIDDFINLELTISTDPKQTAIGVGELVGQWQQDERKYYQYKTSSPIPFRFGVSSAEYAIETEEYQGKKIEIYYHPQHPHNVERLLESIKATVDYCNTNFGEYPFSTIRFAEISNFTKGFAATAYPASVFMTENVVFDSNIDADPKRDAINSLAGHELSHLWWGNNQISPEDREGSAILTETLAMYSELMIAKKVYGPEKMLETVKLNSRMYFDERGFTEEQPLYRAFSENVHLNYYKGAVVMYQLSELIGEDKVNEAMRNFLRNNSYPHLKPITIDLLTELYNVTATPLHSKIDDLFRRITIYEFKIASETAARIGESYQIEFTVEARKFFEDGKGGRSPMAFDDELELEFEMANGEKLRRSFSISGSHLQSQIQIPAALKRIVVDPRVLFLKRPSD